MPNSVLFKMGIVDNTKCNRCSNPIEDHKHLFWECKEVHNLWEKLTKWVNRTFNLEMNVDPRALLFGLLDDVGVEIPDVVWLSLLITKKYIWSSRVNQTPLTLKQCLVDITNIELTEAEMCTKTMFCISMQ